MCGMRQSRRQTLGKDDPSGAQTMAALAWPVCVPHMLREGVPQPDKFGSAA